MADRLRRLHFGVDAVTDTLISAQVPTFRQEVEREIDLVEEIAIVHGYDNIPVTIPGRLPGSAVLTPVQRIERRARQVLRACGLNETISFSMISARQLDQMCYAADRPERNCLVLASPMSEEHALMRASTLPSLLGAVQNNINQRVLDIALYEIGKVFVPTEPDELPLEPTRIGGIITGNPFIGAWNLPPTMATVDFFWLKGIVEQLCEALGVEEVSFLRTTHPSFHPGRCAQLLIGGVTAGVLGELRSEVQEAFDVPSRIYAFELDFELLADRANLVAPYHALPRFPAALRDVAMIVPESDDFTAERLAAAIREAGGEHLVSVEPFDVFADAQRMGPGRKSVAFSLQFRAPDRALTGEELEGAMGEVHRRLGGLGAEVRR
jgi:phenylalanyl-tRNA synthetase beta chain